MTSNQILADVAARTRVPLAALLGRGNTGPGGHDPNVRFARRMASAWLSAATLNFVEAAKVLQRNAVSVRASAIQVHEDPSERALLAAWRAEASCSTH